ncbi:hypothetical protein PT974_03863 [Cladobotryum mycophilum]|uniref:Uncharacterized protein n=1 Tax=Cladobotryum mycophilum TaxID=491253 RepID=A0ABR0STH0_9HYPO
MSSGKKSIGSLNHSLFEEIETIRTTPRSSRSNVDSTMTTGRHPDPGPQSLREYTLTPPWGNTQMNGYTSSAEPGYFTRRLPSSNRNTDERHTTGRYVGCHAGVGVDQINGIVEGSGVQVNGLEVVHYGNTKVPVHPGMDGEWRDMVMISGDGAEMRGSKNQINGGRIRKMGRNEEDAARVRQYVR